MSFSGVGEVAGLVKGVFDRFFPPDATEEQKLAASNAMTAEITNRDEQKANIIVAELNQKDRYTKRARPTVVYGGLLFIAVNYVMFPLVARFVAFYIDDVVKLAKILPITKPLELPTEFWVAWGGIVSTWSLGRSYEKRNGVDGSTNIGRITSLITGKK